ADLVELHLDPLFTRIHLLFLLRERAVVLGAGSKALRVVREVTLGAETFPISAPLFDEVTELLPQSRDRLRLYPFDRARNNDRGEPYLHPLPDRIQVAVR